jgi:D-ribose pyranose/furanose isomerase RbsD
LGEVISNRELYIRIDIGNEAIDSAAEDPAIRQIANNLKINAYILTEEVKEKIARAKEQLALSTRANELLALAKLASLSQIQEQKNSQIRA